MLVSREQKIIELLTEVNGQTDRQLADRIYGNGTHPSSINSECNYLVRQGKIVRHKERGVYRNYLAKSIVLNNVTPIEDDRSFQPLSEDHLKYVLQEHLVNQGWDVQVAWGKTRGIDIEAMKGNDRWVIEVKGHGSLQPMRVNYFISILGELLQRMDDPTAKYSIALPNIKQYRGLWDRLPALAKERTQITALFISENGDIDEV